MDTDFQFNLYQCEKDSLCTVSTFNIQMGKESKNVTLAV